MDRQDVSCEYTKPAYWAVLPANVRYDKRLCPAARLLYAEISALCNKNGFCTASNAYFAELYEKSKRTVEAWMQELKKYGYIETEIIFNECKQIIGRKIWIADHADDPTAENPHDPTEEITDTEKKLYHPTEKNLRNNNTSNNNIPPISPTGEEPKKTRRGKAATEPTEESTVFADYAGDDSNLLNTLLAFDADRKVRRKPMTENAKGLLCKRLDKLADNNAAKIELLEHAIVMGWDSVYPARDKQFPPKKVPAAAPRKESREL